MEAAVRRDAEDGAEAWRNHDPGGRSTFRLANGVEGSATFSPCGRYRSRLVRILDPGNPRRALFIGANPSTARADMDDPTVGRETGFTRTFDCGTLIKVNVMDYRATNPRDLLAPDVVPCSAGNVEAILREALRADLVVVCHGVVHRRLRAHAEAVSGRAGVLAGAGIAMHCLGTTRANVPRHPLYLRKTTPLEVYAPRD